MAKMDDKIRCSFCGKAQSQARKLIAGPGGAYICDECVDICAEIIDEEFEQEGLEDEDELRAAANAVGAKYCAGFEELYLAETEDTIRRGTLCCVEITVDHLTGKIGRQVLLERRKEHGS